MIKDPDKPGDTPGCGLYWLWQKESDPFQEACSGHDSFYDRRKEGKTTPTLPEVDRIFLNRMLNVAGTSMRLKAKAYLFYGIARVWGITARRHLWKNVNLSG